MLEDQTIRLRALEPEDLDVLMRWENDADSWQVGNTLAPYSRYALRQYLEQSVEDLYTTRELKLVIVHKASGESIGLIDLFHFDPHHRRIELGVLVDAAWRRQGVATAAVRLALEYALDFLHLHQVYCLVEENNTASRDMLLAAGLTQGGVWRDWLHCGDGYHHAVMLQKINSL